MDAQLTGKISMTMRDPEGENVNESLGYTRANIISDSVAAATLLTFTRAVAQSLTVNTYQYSKITYDIALDTAWEG